MSETPHSGPDTQDDGPGFGAEEFAPPGDGFGRPDVIPVYPAPPSVPGRGAYPGGYYAPGYYGPPPIRQEPTSGFAVAGLTLGGFSILLMVSPFGPFLSILGIIFSSIGMSKASKPGRSGMGLAITGLVCSLVSGVLWALLIAFVATLAF